MAPRYVTAFRAAFRAAWAWLRAVLAAAWAAVDARDVAWAGGLVLFALARSWRWATVGLLVAGYASFGTALIARIARGKE